MSKIKDLSKFSAEQLKRFLTSFDTVMSDIDGVLSYCSTPIEGASESLKTLKDLGKQVYLITNNNMYTAEEYKKLFDFQSNHVINITKVIIWYLKKIDFRGEILAIVSSTVWDALTEAGLQLVKPQISVNMHPKDYLEEVLDRPSIKAVIVDFDVDCNWLKLALAISCLRRQDVLYISGAMDEWLAINDKQNSTVKILGSGPLIRIISTQSGRTPLVCGKPSETLKDYVSTVCNVTNPRRCLFIGDSLHHDMKFASMCGFMKLFVGTGVNSLEEVQEENRDICPDYYIPRLSQLFAVYND